MPIALAFLFLTLGGCSMNSTSPQVPNELIAHYALNGNAQDAMGTYHGTMHGNLTPVANRKGVKGSALYFGKDSYITLPPIGLLGEVSVFGWVRIDSTGNHPIVAILSQGLNPALRWHIESQPGYIVFYDNRGGDNAPYLVQVGTKYNQWFFYGIVSSPNFPDSAKVRLYLNGNFIGAVSTRPLVEIDSTSLNIGRYYFSNWSRAMVRLTM